ncbi:cytochrome P450 [Bombardia bombarda]|uniref:Cytochrome P450 n=1 Tax=Bombardia bombarda TaxID=252184 RepID=A0AA39XCF7_9PEZI|nr:cytochrome P450 [Bombardia bombarda]
MAFGLWLLAIVGIALLAARSYVNRKRLPPGVQPLPGPYNLPLIGRVHDIPAKASWLKFYEWSKTYGPIYQSEMFGTVHVWISSEKVAHDLLSKRANIYSDRPLIPNLPDNRTSGDYLALLGRTETWKRQRKLCNHLMHTSAIASLHDIPARERDRFLYLMWRDPSNYLEWVEQYTSRTIARLSWGTAHPAQVLRHTTFGLLETISPSGALPNVISFLRHVPEVISPWKKKERARHELETKTFTANVDFVAKMVDEDRAEPSFIRTFLEARKGAEGASEKEQGKWGEKTEAMNVVGLMAIAGALTIGSPIQSFLLAMCHYPEWQTKLQQEIDSALDGRCPQWEDREKLPMLRAVVKEVIRWRPPVPTGIPHSLEKDDIYDGYFIPAGSVIHALEWGITRDESMYPDADAFNPARWLDPSFPTYREPLTQYPNLNGFSQFGFGRRTCQGIPIVEQDLFLAMGGVAWALDIRKKRDPITGAEMHVHWNDYTPLLIAKPTKFPFDALPRSEDKTMRMREMYEDTREDEQQERRDASIFGEKAGEPPVQRGSQEGGLREMEMLEEMNMGMESDHDVLITVRDSSSEGGSYSGGSSVIGDEPSLRGSSPELDDLDEPAEMEMQMHIDGGLLFSTKEKSKKTMRVGTVEVVVEEEGLGVPGAWRWA